mmetsp:Transcript_120077/g.350935  ORF Transcript_120077/g.350935 Transcript_120077/m.350935 type:complete len:262 (+) Transcript_120077:840-1625(+)
MSLAPDAGLQTPLDCPQEGTAPLLASLGGGGKAMGGMSMGHNAGTTMRMSSEAPSRSARRFTVQRSSSASSSVSFLPPPFCTSISGVSLSSRDADSVNPRRWRRPRSTHQSSSCFRTKRDIIAKNVSSLTLLAAAPAHRLMRSSTLSTDSPGCTSSRNSWDTPGRSMQLSASMRCLKRPLTFCACGFEKLATATSNPKVMNSASVRLPSSLSVSTNPYKPAKTKASPILSAGMCSCQTNGFSSSSTSEPPAYVWNAAKRFR